MTNKSDFESNYKINLQTYKAYFFSSIEKANGIHSTLFITTKFQSMVQ